MQTPSSQTPSSQVPSSLTDRLVHPRLSAVAAAALVADFARNPSPKHALVVSAAADSPVLAAAIDALTPADTLTVVAGESTEDVGNRVRLAGAWVEQRVRVVRTVAEADSADSIVVAQAVTGGADETKVALEELAKRLNPGGVVCVAVAASNLLAGGAGEELDRQSALRGVGSDLVLRHVPPVRVHRIRFAPADPALAEGLTPLERTSSVRITPDLRVDSNGVAAAAICLAAATLARRSRHGSGLWLLPALAAAPVAAFFRDPQRQVPDDPAAIVAASDGTVLTVERVCEDRLGGEEFLRIAVFLSVLDVHINRSPVAGRVVDQFTVDGGFAAAMRPDAEHNLAVYTVLDTIHGTVAVAQRTGLVARRIVHRAPVGALLAKGERFGLIRFGSRTDVYLPTGVAAAVTPGDRVLGGETIIARWP